MRVWETVEMDLKTQRSEWEFLELEMVQTAYFPSQKGKQYLLQILGIKVSPPFHHFALK